MRARARSLRGARWVAVAVAAGLVLLGCAAGEDDDGARTAVAPATTPPAGTAEATGRADPAEAIAPPAGTAAVTEAAPAVPGATAESTGATPEVEETYVPPELVGLPSQEVIDRAVVEAETAYLAHWVSYDAAAHSGFADDELREALMVSAGEDTLESLELQVAALDGTGRLIDGDTDVLGIEAVALVPPADGGHGLGVLFDVCVQLGGVLTEEDGTVVRKLSGPAPEFLRARVVDQDGEWLVLEQKQQEAPCPAALGG